MFVDKIKNVFTVQVRTYIYSVCVALFPLLNAYGLVDENIIPKVLSFILGLLGLGTAFAYRPTKQLKQESEVSEVSEVGDNVFVVE